ncbi:histidine phosphatase family protein [Veronia nyctiphanis]|uniref:Histidine phosphatase family protein n=1 Tax=Veronia nyctiphanis TaxID=1278244 RepID=A0A4Q0YIT8_9GAMM|nr:histidine phosphatase family protein [Veronia nyctiphanis]RXJ70610.1 histidine phosphatase family protein [Veronia nyctiphanis]
MAVFKNTYLIMRHGQSEANVADLIVSDPKTGCSQFGLSPLGESQARESALTLGGETLDMILCSDFKRARETAEIVADIFSLPDPVDEIRLRERYFGELEGQPSSAYESVWLQDRLDSSHTDNHVESAQNVCSRAVSLLNELEKKYHDKVILLVAHGDTLQILQTAFHDIDPGQHRSLPHHETGEIKRLASNGDRVPAKDI